MLVKPLDKSTVWHLYTCIGDGEGKTTIGIFEDAEKGLEFIRSFDLSQEIYCTTKSATNQSADAEVSYSIEFTAKEAIDKGFLDMYKFFYMESRHGVGELIHILYLDEVKLNKQLVYTIGEDDY